MPSFFEAAWEISNYIDYTAYLERDPETLKATPPQPNIAVTGFSLSPPLLSRDRPRLSPRKPKMKKTQPVKPTPIMVPESFLTPPNTDDQEMELLISDDDGDYSSPSTSGKLFYPSPPSEDRFIPEYIPGDIMTSKGPPPRQFMEYDDLSLEDQWNIHLTRKDGRSFPNRSKKRFVQDIPRVNKSGTRTKRPKDDLVMTPSSVNSPLRNTWD